MTKVSSGTSAASTASRVWVSYEGLRWATQQMPRTDLTSGDKIVLMAMASHLRGDAYEVWPSRKRLAAMTGCSPASVGRSIDRLAQAGLVHVTARHTEHGDADSNLYTLAVEGALNLTPPPPALEGGVVSNCAPNKTDPEKTLVGRTTPAREGSLL